MATRFNSVEPLDCLFLPWPYFDFDGFMKLLERTGFTGFIRDFLGPSLWPPNKKLICYPFDDLTGKYDLSRLNPEWEALFVDRVAALCDAMKIVILTAREWCGILKRWNIHPWNRRNNRQGLGGNTQLEMTEPEAIETLVMPLFDMCMAALKPKYRQKIRIEISNEPPMLKWKKPAPKGYRAAVPKIITPDLPAHMAKLLAEKDVKWIFPVMDSERYLLTQLRKRKLTKARTSASCAEDSFHAYGEGAFIQGIGAICAHNLNTLADCDQAFAGVYRGFEPGGRYRKHFPVFPNSDGTHGYLWDLSPADARKIATKYEGYGLLATPPPTFKPDSQHACEQWDALWLAAESRIRALQQGI